MQIIAAQQVVELTVHRPQNTDPEILGMYFEIWGMSKYNYMTYSYILMSILIPIQFTVRGDGNPRGAVYRRGVHPRDAELAAPAGGQGPLEVGTKVLLEVGTKVLFVVSNQRAAQKSTGRIK